MPENSERDIYQYFKIKPYDNKGDKLILIFGGWGFGSLIYKPLVKQLFSQGYNVILYIPANKLIAPGTPYTEVVRSVRLAVINARKRIQQAPSNIKDFASLGVSFGSGHAMEVTKEISEIKKVILISSFGDFADHIELWPKNWYFRRIIESQSTTPAESAKILNQVGTTKQLEKLMGKKVLLCYAKNDKMIHSHITDRLAMLLQQNNIDTKVIKIRGGHFAGIYGHLLFQRNHIKFIKDN